MRSRSAGSGDRLVAKRHASRVVASLLILAVGSLPLTARGADSAPRKTAAPDKAGPIITADGRQPGDISLNGEWDFTFTPSSAREIPEFPPQSAFDARVSIPGYWDDQVDRLRKAAWWPKAAFRTLFPEHWNVRYLAGIGWHRTLIDAPPAWKGRSITLTVGLARGTTCVWHNRRLVGRYDHGIYTPFCYDLSGKLKFGEKNELIVALDNTKGFSAEECSFAGFQQRASGISEPVMLHVSDGPGRIADVYVRPGADLKEVVWEVDLDVPGAKGGAPDSRLLWEVSSAANNAMVARGEVEVPGFAQARHVTWSRRIESVKPWSDRQPNLYRTRVQWVAGGQLWDKREDRFGLRRWTAQGRKLFLNGVPVYLRGDTGVYDFPPHVCMPLGKGYWTGRLRRMKELGFNYVVFADKVAPPAAFDAADEFGIIVQAGDPWTSLKQYRRHDEEVWQPLVLWTRAHPELRDIMPPLSQAQHPCW